jgi:secondary thiamine-phosphate synthase enzyme
MRQSFHTLAVATKGPGLYEFTDAAQNFVRGEKIENGLLTCFVRHTSASLLIQENADPDMQKDLQDFFAWLAKSGPRLRHITEGPDDMPAHRGALTRPDRHSPAQDAGAGHLAGFIFRASRRRTAEVVMHLMGD